MPKSLRDVTPVHVVVAALALLLGGCSSSKSADQPADQTSSPVAASATNPPAATDQATPGAPAAGADGGNAYGPCLKLGVAAVQPFYTAPISMKKEDDLVGAASGCIFSTAGDKSNLQIVTVSGPQSATYWDGNLKQDGVPAIPLAGVGDKAMREPKDVWVYALKGDLFCMIHSDRHGRAEMRGLQKFADVDVPDDKANLMAAQLGTLCNTIYGSGTTTPSFAGLD